VRASSSFDSIVLPDSRDGLSHWEGTCGHFYTGRFGNGAYHEVDYSAIAFEIAARMALREGLQKAGAILLEPIMKVEVTSPEDYLGGVIGDLNSRRGQILGTSARGNAHLPNSPLI